MLTTEILMQEHQTILAVLKRLAFLCDRLEKQKPVPEADLRAVITFIREFADRFHHGKEEDLLFPALERAGIPREGGPVGVMLAEHSLGRDHVRAMAEALDQSDPLTFAARARDYIHLLTRHIDKEDHILYPLADRTLSPATQRSLEAAYEDVDRRLDGSRRWREAEELIRRLTAGPEEKP